MKLLSLNFLLEFYTWWHRLELNTKLNIFVNPIVTVFSTSSNPIVLVRKLLWYRFYGAMISLISIHHGDSGWIPGIFFSHTGFSCQFRNTTLDTYRVATLNFLSASLSFESLFFSAIACTIHLWIFRHNPLTFFWFTPTSWFKLSVWDWFKLYVLVKSRTYWQF